MIKLPALFSAATDIPERLAWSHSSDHITGFISAAADIPERLKNL